MSLSRVLPVLVTLSAATLAAQTVVELDPLHITAAPPPAATLTVPSLENARASLALTPGGAGLVDVDQILRGRASTLADTFALAPGVIAQPRFGSDEARLSIRGSGLQRTFHGRGIRVLQDGVPLNQSDGGFDMQSLEPAATAYVTVLRGANALASGASTLGGAIDYVSRTGRVSPGGFGRAELGSWNYFRTTAAGGFASGPSDTYASFTHAEQDGYREHAAQSNQRLFANAGWRPVERVETRFFLTAVRSESELPGSLTKAELETDPRQAAPANLLQDQKRDYDLLRLAAKTTVQISPDTTVHFLAAHAYKDLDHPIFQVIDQLSRDTTLGVTLAHSAPLGRREHLFRAGLLFQHGETDAANYANVFGERGALLSGDDQTAENLEVFAESQLELGAGFTGILGANASRNRRATARTLGAVSAVNTYDRRHERFSPKAGLRWEDPARAIQIFANVSASYEPPSFSESGTTSAANRAQTARTAELGTRGSREWLRWDATVYHADVGDEFLAVQLPPPAPLGQTATINADRTVHEGVELGLEADLLGSAWPLPDAASPTDSVAPAHRLVARGAWTYGRFRFDDDPVHGDNTLAGLPPHLVRGELLWESAAGYYAGPTFEWVPQKTYIDHANTFAADPYALLGFKFGRRVADGFSWFVEAKNLADKTHAATTGVIADAGGVDQRQFLPGDGRSVYVGAEYKF